MNAKTLTQLKQAVARAGGTLEDDGSDGNTRTLQAVAPEGKVWAGTDLACMRIDWPEGGLPWTASGRNEAFADIVERMSYGLREMTPEEAELCATD